MLHLHVRDRFGRHVLDADRYRDAIDGLRSELGDDLVIQITTESAGRYTPSEQTDLVRRVRPECVSLAVGELIRSPDDVGAFRIFLDWLRDEGIAPQFILHTIKDVRSLLQLRNDGVIKYERPFVLLVLGSRETPAQGTADLLTRLRLLDGRAEWMVCVFGTAETSVALASGALGGHARVGFENNIHRVDGSLAQDNASQLRHVRALLEAAGLRTASPTELRTLLAAD